MKKREDVVAAIIDAAGGSLVGRIRLQKAAYLLERLGLGSGLSFDYHHYGPFSRDLDNAAADAKAFGLVEEKLEQRQSDGATYSVFHVIRSPGMTTYGRLTKGHVESLAQLFAATNLTVLELAATIDWLWNAEECSDWQAEIRRRKGVKVQNGRLERAIDLLNKIGLAPPPSADHCSTSNASATAA